MRDNVSSSCENVFHSYCPNIYEFNNQSVEQTIKVCDDSLPYVVEDFPFITGFANGEVVTGGYGVLRFHHGNWSRIPTSLGFVNSAAFFSVTEAWLASPGSFNGSLALSTSITIGHLTEAPETATLDAVDKEVREILEKSEKDATEIIHSNRTIVEAMVSHLLEHETMSGPPLVDLLQKVRPAVIDLTANGARIYSRGRARSMPSQNRRVARPRA